MIKIIKPGKVPTCYQMECVKCHCIFHFEDEDINEKDYLTSFDSIVCPCCKLKLYLIDGRSAYYYREEDNDG